MTDVMDAIADAACKPNSPAPVPTTFTPIVVQAPSMQPRKTSVPWKIIMAAVVATAVLGCVAGYFINKRIKSHVKSQTRVVDNGWLTYDGDDAHDEYQKARQKSVKMCTDDVCDIEPSDEGGVTFSEDRDTRAGPLEDGDDPNFTPLSDL